ncbi:MAG: hypothetical protein ACRDHZ_16290 [Ktedonobacteraceae bacterium]
MDAHEKDLHQRDKATLIAIIERMLQLQPDLAWVLETAQPAPTQGTQTLNPAPYRQQIQAAITAASKNDRDRKYCEEMRNTLTTIQTIAVEYNQRQESFAALAIYEVLLSEVIAHFNDIRTEYVIFTTTLYSCIDGLDTCFADNEEHTELRLRVLKALFTIYRFFTDAHMDLDEDIPGLLIANANAEERQTIANWVREAQASHKNNQWAPDEQTYRVLLHQLEKP